MEKSAARFKKEKVEHERRKSVGITKGELDYIKTEWEGRMTNLEEEI